MSLLNKLKIKLADIHLETGNLDSALLNLKGTVTNLDIDGVMDNAVLEEVDKCLKLNREIREKSKGGLK